MKSPFRIWLPLRHRRERGTQPTLVREPVGETLAALGRSLAEYEAVVR